jgi:hypothetical protein
MSIFERIKDGENKTVFWIGAIVILIAFFFAGYFFGKNGTPIPIIIEKCGEAGIAE